MFCQKCGTQLSDAASFCSKCGESTNKSEINIQVEWQTVSHISKITEYNSTELMQILSKVHDALVPYFNLCAEMEKLLYLQESNQNGLTRATTTNSTYLAMILSPEEVRNRDRKLALLGMSLQYVREEHKKRVYFKDLYFLGPTKKELINQHTKRAEIYEKEINELQLRLDSAFEDAENAGVMKIPEDYRYPLALHNMCKYLQNYKADNLKECINLFDDQLHKWRMEELAEENLNFQRQQLLVLSQISRNTRAAAIFSGITAFNTR